MRTYKLTIAYDGSRYQGWQRQATTDNTIQFVLEWSIGKLVGYRVHVDGSGRTDAGVHARGQVASVKLSKLYDTKELKDSLNRYLPEDIRIVKVELVKNGFHARKSAKGKKYEYYIDCREKPDVFSRRYCYHYPEKLDIEAMRDAVQYLIGPKNFTSFTDDKAVSYTHLDVYKRQGYDLQNGIREELLNRGIYRTVSTILTQVIVDPYDEAFYTPTKVLGRYMNAEEANEERKKGNYVVEEPGKGFRRIVSAPNPVSIVEIDAIKALLDADQIVVACGGGGIPVLKQDNHLKGASAVIEKDLTAGKLAEEVDADELIILTSVEKVKINMGRPQEEELGEITIEQARQYMEEGHFGEYNMLPKFSASVSFLEKREGRRALITSFDKLKDALKGRTGTIIK